MVLPVQRVVHVDTIQALVSIKWGPGLKRAPKSYPKKSLYKMGTWVDLATCQKHQKVLRISQKKTFYRGIKWWVIRVPGYLYFIEEIATGISKV